MFTPAYSAGCDPYLGGVLRVGGKSIDWKKVTNRFANLPVLFRKKIFRRAYARSCAVNAIAINYLVSCFRTFDSLISPHYIHVYFLK